MRVAALAALVVVAAACGSGGGSVPDRFTGTWSLQDGRTIPIRRVSDAEGKRAMHALGGMPCVARAAYFRSTYFGGAARLAGCAIGDGRVLQARFDDNGITGRIVQRLTAPNRFVAVVQGDGHPPFRIIAVRVG